MNVNIILKNHTKHGSFLLAVIVVVVLAITGLCALARKYKIDTFNIVEINGGKHVLQTVTLVNDFPSKDIMVKINKTLQKRLIESYSKPDIDDENQQKCAIESYMRQVEINNSWLSFRQDYSFSCETAVHPGYDVEDYNIDLNSGDLIDLNAEIDKNVKNIREFKEFIVGKFVNSIPEIRDYLDGLNMTHILYYYHPSYLVRENKLVMRLIGFCYAVQSYEEFEVGLTFNDLCPYLQPDVNSVLSGFCKK